LKSLKFVINLLSSFNILRNARDSFFMSEKVIEIPEVFQNSFRIALPDLQTFSKLAFQSTDLVFAGSHIVKVVIQFFSGPQEGYPPQIYFLDSKRYQIHWPFCQWIYRFLALRQFGLGYRLHWEGFNTNNYLRYPREFFLLSIVWYEDKDLFTVEMVPRDNLPPEGIKIAHEMITRHSFIGDRLKWAILSPVHEENFRQVDIPGFFEDKTVRMSDLFQSISYQPLFMGPTVGVVRIWPDDTEKFEYDERTILVADALPTDLTPLRGLVTQQIQTPLCHVALLCNSRKTPNMSIKDAIELFRPYEGKLVSLEVAQNTYEVTPVEPDHASRWLSDRDRGRKKVKLSADFETRSIDLIGNLEKRQMDAMGAKILNFRRLLQISIPDVNQTIGQLSFAIPFYYFRAFLSETAPDAYHRLQQEGISAIDVKDLSRAIREKLIAVPIGDRFNLRSEIFSIVNSWGKSLNPAIGDGIIFRSSTNCEDLPGFPSAGLYDSEAVLKMEWPDMDLAIRKVWASTFGDRAILERRSFGLQEMSVGMAILVMPLLRSSVKANGVGLTINPYRFDLGGAFVNVQVGTTAVTSSCGGAVPEQVLFVRDDPAAMAMQYISSSSLLESGEYIVTQPIGAAVHIMLKILHAQFDQSYNLNSKSSRDNALDVEFFILNTNEIVVVQARPIEYQIRKLKDFW
jgi:hypothetical protein